MKTNVIIMPSLNPNEKMIKLIKELKEMDFNDIIVINDGSGNEYNNIYKEAKDLGCHVAIHEINLGKGRAIKTGVKYALENFKELNGVITVDSDGQHIPKDVKKISDELNKNKKELVIGVRDFEKMNVPFRSRLGNKFSRMVFRLITGTDCIDTQTGLRGIPKDYFDLLLEMEGDRYELEMNFLIEAANSRIKFCQIPIETIYENKNEVSHFRPLIDSFLVYKKIFKFALTGIFSEGVDLSIFRILTDFIGMNTYFLMMGANVISKCISAIFNYILNRTWCFKSKNDVKEELAKYIVLFVCQTAIGSVLTASIAVLSYMQAINPTWIKFFVDIVLFIFSYVIQRKYIFNSKVMKKKKAKK